MTWYILKYSEREFSVNAKKFSMNGRLFWWLTCLLSVTGEILPKMLPSEAWLFCSTLLFFFIFSTIRHYYPPLNFIRKYANKISIKLLQTLLKHTSPGSPSRNCKRYITVSSVLHYLLWSIDINLCSSRSLELSI